MGIDAACPIWMIARYYYSKKVQAFLKENKGSIMAAYLLLYQNS
jgi:hypothetical protein